MGWNDRMDEDDGKIGFLKDLLDYGMLDAKADGIARQVIDSKRTLSEKQEYIFDKRVIDRFTTPECERCHDDIPRSEMLKAHKNGGYCGRCVHDLCGELDDIGQSWEDVYGDDMGVFLRDLWELHQITESEEKKKAPKRRGFFN